MTRRLKSAMVALPFILVAASALSQEWTAGMVEEEGGPAMMASIAGPGSGAEFPPELFMFCGGGNINLRYFFPVGEGVEPPNEKPVAFTFEFGKGSATLDMQYEEMDGAYAAYFPTNDKVVDLFKSGATVIVDDPTGLYQVQAFPLTGSTKAIDTLIAQCD